MDLPSFEGVEEIYEAATKGDSNLVLMGIHPTYPSEKYGYIRPQQDEKEDARFTFTEKPSKAKAEEYIEQGALWNGRVLGYKLSYVLKKVKGL